MQQIGHFEDGEPYGHIRVTDAPESYDGFGTRTIETLPFIGKFRSPFRRVSIPEAAKHGDWQEARYGSGLYESLSAQQFDELREYISTPAPTDGFHVLRSLGGETACGQEGRAKVARRVIVPDDLPAMCPACRWLTDDDFGWSRS